MSKIKTALEYEPEQVREAHGYLITALDVLPDIEAQLMVLSYALESPASAGGMHHISRSMNLTLASLDSLRNELEAAHAKLRTKKD